MSGFCDIYFFVNITIVVQALLSTTTAVEDARVPLKAYECKHHRCVNVCCLYMTCYVYTASGVKTSVLLLRVEKNIKVKREEEEQVDQAPEMKRKKKVKDEIDMKVGGLMVNVGCAVGFRWTL